MQPSRTLNLIVTLVACAACGVALIVLPGWIIDQYHRVSEYGPVARWVYLISVGVGVLMLLGSVGWVAWAIWRNTAASDRKRRRAAKSAREMTSAEKRSAVTEQLDEARRYADDAGELPEVREAIERGVADLETKIAAQSLRIVAFGTISSGKSSLLNALAGQDVFTHDVRGGTTVESHDVPWPNDDRVTLVDTPGLGEIDGGDHARVARDAARAADLVLFVVDGPIKDFEYRTLAALHEMDKRIVVCLNKQDWYADADRDRLLAQLRQQTADLVEGDDVVAVRSRAATTTRVRVAPDGSEREEPVELAADIAPLVRRLMKIVTKDGTDLLLSNLLLQSRGLVKEVRTQVMDTLDAQARKLIDSYTWKAAGAAALTPVPVLDIAIGLGFSAKMVVELAHVYRQAMDFSAAKATVQELSKNLASILGVHAAAPAIANAVGSSVKAVPGVGTIVGGVLQGLVQALITQWIGRTMRRHFRAQLLDEPRSLSQTAAEQWSELTSPSELINLARTGMSRLSDSDDATND
ncbi:MAG: DUF697 domain-containing protein [Phycisphaera sp.]|nr:DUF697 domain-containing protein [Phycisphaera sp.]